MKLFVSFTLATALLTGCSAAYADRSYIAKVNEDNEFCARIKPAGDWRSVKVCKSIEDWKTSGYRVDVKKPAGNIEKAAEV